MIRSYPVKEVNISPFSDGQPWRLPDSIQYFFLLGIVEAGPPYPCLFIIDSLIPCLYQKVLAR